MRKGWALLGTSLVVALVGGLSAQTPVNFNVGGKTPTFKPINTEALLPKVNVSKAVAPPKVGPKNFEFSSLLPSFSFLERRFPTTAPKIKIPAPPPSKTKKK